MLNTHSQRVLEARRNDIQEAEALRETLIDDVLHLQEMSEARAETRRKLTELRSSSVRHLMDLASTIRREHEIDNVRLQPLLESIKSGIRKDLNAVRALDAGWDKVYAKRAALESAVDALDAARSASGEDSPKASDVSGITAAIKEDSALLMQLSGGVRLLQSVTATGSFGDDPRVKETLARAKVAVESIAHKRIALLENALDVSQESDDSNCAIAIETALIGVMAARAGSLVDVHNLKAADPAGRSPRIILKEARSYLQVSVRKLFLRLLHPPLPLVLTPAPLLFSLHHLRTTRAI